MSKRKKVTRNRHECLACLGYGDGEYGDPDCTLCKGTGFVIYSESDFADEILPKPKRKVKK